MIQEHYASQAFVVPKMTDESVQRIKLIDKSRSTPGRHILHHHPSSAFCEKPTKCETYENGSPLQ